MWIGLFCLIVSLVLIYNTLQIKLARFQYDNHGSATACTAVQVQSTGCQFDMSINVPEEIPGPVFVYYELDGFYQNHRTYLSSYYVTQLQGNEVDPDTIDSACSPVVHNKDGDNRYLKNYNNTESLDQSAFANPCGLIAKSHFNGSPIP